MIEENNYNIYSNFFIATDEVTLILLLIALGIFLWLAIKSKNVKNFQFQISIFIVIWLLGDLVDVLHNNLIFTFSTIPDIGLRIHVISMIFFTPFTVSLTLFTLILTILTIFLLSLYLIPTLL